MIHIGVWLVFYAFVVLLTALRSSYSEVILLDVLFTELPSLYIFYGSYILYRKFMRPLKIGSLFIAGVLLFLSDLLLWYIIGSCIAPLINPSQDPIKYNSLFFAAAFWLFIVYSFFAFGYYYFGEAIERERQLRAFEKEKSNAEYAFLRAQINPHFLNNTLNFFYAKSLRLSPELAEGIMTLCDIMRYSLEKDKEDHMVRLDDEIVHVLNVIKINQLRFSNRLNIDLRIPESLKSYQVVPLILITIVENVLKHGDCIHKKNPVKIHLDVDVYNRIRIYTFNVKKKGPKELSSGIGMDNIKRRLDHHYGNGYQLMIDDHSDTYSLELLLPGHYLAAHLTT